MDLLLILLLMIAGFLFGAFVAIAGVNAPLPLIIVSASFFSILAALMGYLFLYAAKADRVRQARFRKPPSRRPMHRQTTESFSLRLARFTGKSQDQVMVSRDRGKSTMKFWTSVKRFAHVPPKSAETIRQTLLAIRRILRR